MTSSIFTADFLNAPKLSDDLGAGSLTALPVIETKAAMYLPISLQMLFRLQIGQIFLQDDLFKSGVRPAVDVGISVSRVGSAAQIKAMKTAVGRSNLTCNNSVNWNHLLLSVQILMLSPKHNLIGDTDLQNFSNKESTRQ
ncbi:MAG: hypothetical protein CM15mP49_31240 [Actinomycetota bacterium]|nr:MAG: hypothetical protein CM15mP49_31240 [Actinomycetota bacterium]